MKRIRPDPRFKYPACLVAGALTSFAFAPYHLSLLAVLMPVVLLACWLHTTPRTAFVLGYLYGLGLFGAGISWLHISINLFGGVSFAVALLLTFVFVAIVSLYPALAGYLVRRCFSHRDNLSLLLIVVPAVWVLVEWLRGWLFTGFPWLNLGYSHVGMPLDGLAPVAGVYAVSWAIMATAGALTGLVAERGRWRLWLAVPAGIWGVAWLAGGIQWTGSAGDDISVALVQGAVPQEVKWEPEMRQTSMDLYLDLSRPYLGSDLIIWPETAIPAFYHQARDYLARVGTLARQHGSGMLIGIPVIESDGRYYNSIVSPQENLRRYDKRHLVPFGEFMPFGKVLDRLLRFLAIPMSNFSPGEDVRPLLEVGDIMIGVSICYEDAFGEEVIEALPEARILVNISNDAWFGDSAAAHQHLQMARMRARETGRYLLRSTNTGISAVIDAWGEVLVTTPQFQPAVLSHRAEPRQGRTPYVVAGNFTVVTVSLLLLAMQLRRRRGRDGDAANDTPDNRRSAP